MITFDLKFVRLSWLAGGIILQRLVPTIYNMYG